MPPPPVGSSSVTRMTGGAGLFIAVAPSEGFQDRQDDEQEEKQDWHLVEHPEIEMAVTIGIRIDCLYQTSTVEMVDDKTQLNA